MDDDVGYDDDVDDANLENADDNGDDTMILIKWLLHSIMCYSNVGMSSYA